MKTLKSMGAMWRTFWIQLPVPTLLTMPLTLMVATEPFATDRLSLEFWNLFGYPDSRHELAVHLESRDTSETIGRRALRLYESNVARDARSAARYLEIAHLALTTGQPSHLLERRPVDKLSGFTEQIGRLGNIIRDPALMRLRAFQLTDDQYLKVIGPHVRYEQPDFGQYGWVLGEDEARAIKAYALLLAASKLDGQPPGALLSSLGRRMDSSGLKKAESYSRQLVSTSRYAVKLEKLNRAGWGDVWKLAWKSMVIVVFSVAAVASVSIQIGSWVVLGAGWIRRILLPAVYILSPVPFAFGYHLVHGVSDAQRLPLLAPVTAVALIIYVICILAMRDWIASRANVSPAEI